MNGLIKGEQAVVDPNEKDQLLYRISDKKIDKICLWRNGVDKRKNIELSIVDLENKIND